jgi:hypothetical protein
MTEAGSGHADDLFLDAYIPAWKLRRLRIGSWLLVAALSILGVYLRTFLLQPPGIRLHTDVFVEILLIRWLLSALLGGSAADYTLTMAEGLQTEKGGDHPKERSEFGRLIAATTRADEKWNGGTERSQEGSGRQEIRLLEE